MSTPEDKPSSQPPAEVRWCFGSFVVWETQRRLERQGKAVRVGPRSFDLLLQLLKRAGEFASKEELLSQVWTGVVVEEGSVRVHMSTLRKALGDPAEGDGCKEWISNVPHRGYRFNGQVRAERGDAVPAKEARPQLPPFVKPPVRLTGLVGRDGEVRNVLAALAAHRLVTIVGPGGMGKTSVAIRAAEQLQAGEPATPVAFADLAPLISRDHVPGTIARSLGVAADMPDVVQAIVERLRGQSVLLLIDNCEHVLDSLALPVTRLLAALPGLRVLATSREVLRVAGEYVLRLAALPVPGAEGVTLPEVMQWPSVQLLVERARAAGAGEFGNAHAPLLARISQRLDGIPLAIELVAARLAAQSLFDLALRLDDHLRLHSQGNRSVLPRHKTLAAALDWSMDLLEPGELRLFCQLSVFRGRFDVESALAVAIGMDTEAAFDALISLANKSLVFFDGNDAIAPYRLLDTTRSYAAALLAQGEDRQALRRRHVAFMLDVMQTATADLPKLGEQAWADQYAYRLDDVRFALEACLNELADAKTATALLAASAPLWFHLSQLVEYGDRVAAALALLEQQPVPDPQTAAALNTALVATLLQTGGSNEELEAACDRALAGVIAIQVPELELRARWGRCTHDMFRGAYSAALRHSQALQEFVQTWPEPSAVVLSLRVSAMATHFCGRFEESKQHSAAALARGSALARTHVNMVGPDSAVATEALLCRTLWIQGETAQALDVAREAIARAEAIGHAVSLCAGLYGACVVALWAGEQELARKWVPLMVEEARRKGLLGWLRYADWYSVGLQLELAPDRDAHVREVLQDLSTHDLPCREMLVTFCPDWLDDGLVESVASGGSQWVAPEVWRAAGRRSERGGRLEEAEAFYLRAIAIAREQGARGWELRAAQSLAGLQRGERAARAPRRRKGA